MSFFHNQSVVSFPKKNERFNSFNNSTFFKQSTINPHTVLNNMIQNAYISKKVSENIDDEMAKPGPNNHKNISLKNQAIIVLDPEEIKKNKTLPNIPTNQLEEQKDIYKVLPEENFRKKTVVEFRLKGPPLVNKRIRKRLISKTYHTWLRPSVNKTSWETDNKGIAKILIYGKYKATRDTRPMICPYHLYKLKNHVGNEARIFPKKYITPLRQKKCICEFFTITKSPLKQLI